MRRKKSVIFLAALSLSALFVFSSLGAQDDSARFVSGTKINSVGVGGLTPEEAKERIQGFYAGEYKLSIRKKDGTEDVSADRLTFYRAQNIVVDPVMVATSGAKLIGEDAIEVLKAELFPLAALLTPNIPEAEVLSGRPIRSEKEMEEAAAIISETYDCGVLLKGGHRVNDANDLLVKDTAVKWFAGRRISNPNTHGTGCTLSSAIASNLAKGMALEQAVDHAKRYISGALAAGLDLGKGSGPMDHGFAVRGEY